MCRIEQQLLCQLNLSVDHLHLLSLLCLCAFRSLSSTVDINLLCLMTALTGSALINFVCVPCFVDSEQAYGC